MRLFGGAGFGSGPIARGGAVLALAAFAALDVFLITLAVHHSRSRTPETIVAISKQERASTPVVVPKPTPASATAALTAATWTPGASPLALSSYGECSDGYVTANKTRVAGVGKVLAATGATGVLAGLDSKCKPQVFAFSRKTWHRVSGLTVPTGPAGAASDVLWIVGANSALVVNTSGASVGHPKSPCTLGPAPQMQPTFVVASSAKVAEVFCTRPATSTGQLRSVRRHQAARTGSTVMGGSLRRQHSAVTTSGCCSPTADAPDCSCGRARTADATGSWAVASPTASGRWA
jgi:hypothetical protein